VRFVIFGAGAIGGVLGARLHQAGQDVLLIARGPHHDAIAAGGLTLETPAERATLPLPVARAPQEIEFGPDDVVVLAIKTQDTVSAVEALAGTAPANTPLVCAQNGVENERIALRRFPNVYGAVVMAPTAHLEPGVVRAYGTRLTGQIDVGRYPHGVDDCCRAICEAIGSARFDSESQDQVMRHKYAKLLANLANAVQVICGVEAPAGELVGRVRDEGERVLDAAGIEFDVPEVADIGGRWQRWGVGEIEGRPRAGGSSWQSVVRGTGSIETDYLNGEVVLLARQHGVEAPLNRLLQELARETLRDRHQPGWLSPDQVLGRVPPS
jgi:2-dehydropantoate 2-reductase